MSSDKKCFVIAPLGEPESETRKRSDQVLKHVIRPAVGECGYEAIRADEIDKPGIITSQVLQHIVDDPLVVADLTERNPNVFYELAIRHALRKPLVQLMKKGEQIPFDVAGARTIFVDHHDLDSVAEAKERIADQVRELESDPSGMETPISLSLEIQGLRQSEKPEDRSLADLVAAVSGLRSGSEDQFRSIQGLISALPEQVARFFDGSSRVPPRGRRGYEAVMSRELAELGASVSPAVEILLAVSGFRESVPWIHELGLEVFRALGNGNTQRARFRLDQLRRVTERAADGPWIHFAAEQSGDDVFMMLGDLNDRLERIAMKLDERKRER